MLTLVCGENIRLCQQYHDVSGCRISKKEKGRFPYPKTSEGYQGYEEGDYTTDDKM